METWREHRTAEVRISSEGRAIRKNGLGEWEEFRLESAIFHGVIVKGRWRSWTAKKIVTDIEGSGAPWFPLDVDVVWLPEPEPEPEPEPKPARKPVAPRTPTLTPAALNLLGIKTLDPEQPKSIWAGDRHTCPVCNSPVARRGQNCGSYSCKRTLRRGGHRTFVQQPRKAIDTI